MEALDKNEAWDLVELPDGRKLVHSKWVFKKRLNVEVQSSTGSKRVFSSRGN